MNCNHAHKARLILLPVRSSIENFRRSSQFKKEERTEYNDVRHLCLACLQGLITRATCQQCWGCWRMHLCFTLAFKLMLRMCAPKSEMSGATATSTTGPSLNSTIAFSSWKRWFVHWGCQKPIRIKNLMTFVTGRPKVSIWFNYSDRLYLPLRVISVIGIYNGSPSTHHCKCPYRSVAHIVSITYSPTLSKAHITVRRTPL